MKHAAWKKSGGWCWYCGATVDRRADANKTHDTTADGVRRFAVDHLLSLAAGGTNEPANLIPCCRPCNSAKGHRSLARFRMILGMLQGRSPRFTDEQLAWLASHSFNVRCEIAATFFFEDCDFLRLIPPEGHDAYHRLMDEVRHGRHTDISPPATTEADTP